MSERVDGKFLVEHCDFKQILGSDPKIDLVHHDNLIPFAHEAGVYLSEFNELIVTSNQINDGDGGRKVRISRVILGNGDGDEAIVKEIPSGIIHMANGGVNYQDGILLCAQGSTTHPSGLFKIQAHPPYLIVPVVTSFMGKPFNSVNDVVIHSDGSIWFTDPAYGHDQGYRPRPSLPNVVYRYNTATKGIRALADQFGRPNGICFSPDEKTVYITDTDQIRGPCVDCSRVSSIYAFDVAYHHGEPFLANRRLFAMADTGIPDGIKCDAAGNVYSGCGDGINIWSPGGVLLGKILFSGGIANLCFGRQGELFALNEHWLWRVRLDPTVKGALLNRPIHEGEK